MYACCICACHSNQTPIVEKPDKAVVHTGYWGIVPLFNKDSTLAIGTHQIALCCGAFPTELLQADSPVNAVLQGIKAKTYKVGVFNHNMSMHM